MNLRDLEYFQVVAEQRHLGRAADELGLSTAALSKSLRRLENSMQAKLVRRTPKGVDLTAAGAALLVHVDRLRLTLDDVAREAADLSQGRSGNLRVGAGSGLGEFLSLAPCTTLLNESSARVTLNVVVADYYSVLLPALRKGQFDLVVSGTPLAGDEGLLQEHLHEDEIIIAVSERHRLAGRARVGIADLAQERWALADFSSLPSRRLRQAFQDHRLPEPKVAMASNSVWLRLRVVADTNLLTFSSKRVFRECAPPSGLVILRVKELAWKRNVYVTYRQDAYLAPAARRFIDVLKLKASALVDV